MNAPVGLLELEAAMPPPSERLLWEGRPAWSGIALGLFRLHFVGLYFAVLAVGRAAYALLGGSQSLGAALLPAAVLLGLGTACVALLASFAWAVRATTRYSITDYRVILHYGVALPATLAIPYGAIEAVALRLQHRGCGDVSISLKRRQQIGYAKLWPHARPWCLAAPAPMLRALTDAAVVGPLLVRAVHTGVARLAAEASQTDRLGADAGWQVVAPSQAA